jgi:hypothetical protein
MTNCLPQIREMRKKKWLDSYRRTFNKTSACKAIKVNRSTVWRWVQNDPEFSESLQDLEEQMLDEAEGALMKLVREADFRAIKFLLQTKGRSRGYGEKLQIEKTTKHETIDTKRLELILKKDTTRRALEILARNSLEVEVENHE